MTDDVTVSLDLLDKPSFDGDTADPTRQNTLQSAIGLLPVASGVDNDIVISVAAGTDVVVGLLPFLVGLRVGGSGDGGDGGVQWR